MVRSVCAADLHLSVLVVGEIRQGIERLARRDPVQATVFERWLSRLVHDYRDRIVPVSNDVAEAWGRLNGSVRAGPPSHTLIDRFVR